MSIKRYIKGISKPYSIILWVYDTEEKSDYKLFMVVSLYPPLWIVQANLDLYAKTWPGIIFYSDSGISFYIISLFIAG